MGSWQRGCGGGWGVGWALGKEMGWDGDWGGLWVRKGEGNGVGEREEPGGQGMEQEMG